MTDLFQAAAARRIHDAPLAERMRPKKLEDVLGQPNLLGANGSLRKLIESDRLPSLILYGPPGTGKTTLARLIAQHTRARFETLSAVLSGVAELREVLRRADRNRAEHGERTLLFVDEIHRWSKSQQDALLDAVERGVVTLVGATTENPSFELNKALLSRVRVLRLEPLDEASVVRLLERTLTDPQGLGSQDIEIDPGALGFIARSASGDARRALAILDHCARELEAEAEAPEARRVVDQKRLERVLAREPLLYDKAGDQHYGVVSAFIKSMRGSDPDASVYYLMRMLEGGEDARFVVRRMVIFASEDVGNADPEALGVAVHASAAVELVGMPEGVYALTQAATYLAMAPKSNAALRASHEARNDVRAHGPLPVPTKLLNATDAIGKNAGHGAGYRYPHDEEGFVAGEVYLPDRLAGRRYYEPTNRGREEDHQNLLRSRVRKDKSP
jgi:putative ATPase